MELRYLRYFIAVAEDLSFSRAGERLHVDQSALSRRVQDLEAELNVPLFNRTRHRVELTAAGMAFLEQARRLIADTGHAIETARRAARGEVGRLDIGYISALSDVLIPRLMRDFRARFPQVALTLQHLRAAAQISALLSGRIHLGFVGLPNPEYRTQLVFEIFRRDPMQVALPSGHTLLALKQIRLADLGKEKFVFMTRAGSPHYYDWMVKLCHETGFHPQIVQEVEHRQTAIELVAAGYGIALFPATAQHWIQEGVVFRRVKGMPLYEHSVAWRRGDESPAIHAFLNLLREERGAKLSARDSEREGKKAPA